jgi:diguanylate cyclase (GGDEF)-like protein
MDHHVVLADVEFRYTGTEDFAWLGLRFESDGARLKLPLLNELINHPELINSLLILIGIVASHSCELRNTLVDPVTLLLGSSELHRRLDNLLARKQTFCFLLINPDDFKQINQQHGRRIGDQILYQVAVVLRRLLGASAILSRYGAAHFAAIVPYQSHIISEKKAIDLQQALTGQLYAKRSIMLNFRIGMVTQSADSQSELSASSVILLADEALAAAKQSSKEMVMTWDDSIVSSSLSSHDRLRGIFSTAENKNYRNMLLLWEFSSLISTSSNLDSLLSQFVNCLYQHFEPTHLFVMALSKKASQNKASEQYKQTLISGCLKNDNKPSELSLLHQISCYQADVIEQCKQRSTMIYQCVKQKTDQSIANCYAFPIITEGRYLGCVYMQGSVDCFQIDPSDKLLVDALLGQIANLLERIHLESELKHHQQQEQLRLRQEVKALRSALEHANLVYCSPQMEKLLAKVQKVASTDASVLVVGETGTGKELLAQTIHSISPRASNPFVIIDCGSIPEGLTESELFGHEKGAFTSAGVENRGRIIEAEGGTLVLDEVGEIPLLVQAKLLRFVQEKQFTAVGSSKTRKVDVRIIAVTNRDLAKEVAAGRFREDLYFRLQVVEIKSPALRDRPSDIPYLIEHFLSVYSSQYKKPAKHLSMEARQQALRYPWPGNVRELQNLVIRAAILTDSSEIGPADFFLETSDQVEQLVSPSNDDSIGHSISLPVDVSKSAFDYTHVRDVDLDPDNLASHWQKLRELVSHQIQLVTSQYPMPPIPFGDWLNDDLVLIAYKKADNVSRQAALLIGIPESTFRRKLKKARGLSVNNLAPRTSEWDEVRRQLSYLVERKNSRKQDLNKKIQQLLFSEIMELIPQNIGVSARLMGVSEPTFRKRLAVHSNN